MQQKIGALVAANAVAAADVVIMLVIVAVVCVNQVSYYAPPELVALASTGAGC